MDRPIKDKPKNFIINLYQKPCKKFLDFPVIRAKQNFDPTNPI